MGEVDDFLDDTDITQHGEREWPQEQVRARSLARRKSNCYTTVSVLRDTLELLHVCAALHGKKLGRQVKLTEIVQMLVEDHLERVRQAKDSGDSPLSAAEKLRLMDWWAARYKEIHGIDMWRAIQGEMEIASGNTVSLEELTREMDQENESKEKGA